jgi:hypothetical protein
VTIEQQKRVEVHRLLRNGLAVSLFDDGSGQVSASRLHAATWEIGRDDTVSALRFECPELSPDTERTLAKALVDIVGADTFVELERWK